MSDYGTVVSVFVNFGGLGVYMSADSEGLDWTREPRIFTVFSCDAYHIIGGYLFGQCTCMGFDCVPIMSHGH